MVVKRTKKSPNFLFKLLNINNNSNNSNNSNKRNKRNNKKNKGKKTKKKVPDYYRQYISKYYDKNMFPNEVETKTRHFNWGIGLEHEMQLFHISKSKDVEDVSRSNILFDSQESTCFLLKDKSKEGPCCKLMTRNGSTCYNNNPKTKKLFKAGVKISEKVKEWLKTIPWELSGRQSKGCTPDTTLLKRVPTLMPEFVTTSHKNRSMESLCNELLFLENKFIELQMKNPHTKQKVKRYGQIRQLPYGAISKIRIPNKHTIGNEKYDFIKEDYIDYLGSYHVTITLPCPEDITDKEFIENHQNFANQLQWIEPLLISAFFSADPRSVADSGKKTEGSFRIMYTGWGNIAGADLRKIGKGLGRYGNIESHWRKTLNFEDSKKLHKCNNEVQIDEPGAIGILGSDFRTFGFDHTDKCPGKECPKVSGSPIVYPNGIEIRIFDHFNSSHLIDLLRIIVYIAENSRNHKCNNYVYNNKSWKNAMRLVMKEGWNAVMEKSYIEELRINLGLELDFGRKKAFGTLVNLTKELFDKNHNGMYSKLLLEKKYELCPRIPEINRFSWQISFNKLYGEEMTDFIKDNFKKGNTITIKKFKSIFYKSLKKIWEEDIEDLLYALEAKPNFLLKTITDKGHISKIKIL